MFQAHGMSPRVPVVDVRGNPDDLSSSGHSCAKGQHLGGPDARYDQRTGRPAGRGSRVTDPDVALQVAASRSPRTT